MNKSDLVEVVSAKLGDRKAASQAVEAVVDAITRAVAKGEKVGITGFGVFEKIERAARTARNPTTGEAVPLGITSVVRFRPGQGFKDIVSGATPVSDEPTARAVTARAGSRTTVATGQPARVPSPRRSTPPTPDDRQSADARQPTRGVAPGAPSAKAVASTKPAKSQRSTKDDKAKPTKVKASKK